MALAAEAKTVHGRQVIPKLHLREAPLQKAVVEKEREKTRAKAKRAKVLQRRVMERVVEHRKPLAVYPPQERKIAHSAATGYPKVSAHEVKVVIFITFHSVYLIRKDNATKEKIACICTLLPKI